MRNDQDLDSNVHHYPSRTPAPRAKTQKNPAKNMIHSDLKTRFSNAGEAHRWNDMYSTGTKKLDELNFRERRDLAVDYVLKSLPDGGRVLDMGCGAGPVLTELRKRGINCIGLEQSPDMLEHARRRLSAHGLDESGLHQGDCRTTPFADSTFDVIVCLGVISYIEDYASVLLEIKRLLKPGGIALISFRNVFNFIFSDPVSSLGWIKRKIRRHPESEPFVAGRALDFREFCRKIEALGFSFREFFGVGFGPARFRGREIFSETTSIMVSSSLARLFRSIGWRQPFLWLTDVSIWVYEREPHR